MIEPPDSPLVVTGRSTGSERPDLLHIKMSTNRRYGNDRHNINNRTFTNNRQRDHYQEPPTPRKSTRGQGATSQSSRNDKQSRYGLDREDKGRSQPRYGVIAEMDETRHHVVPGMHQDSFDEGDRYEDADARGRTDFSRFHDDDERYEDKDERDGVRYDDPSESQGGYGARNYTESDGRDDDGREGDDVKMIYGGGHDGKRDVDDNYEERREGKDEDEDRDENESQTYRYDKLFMTEG